MEATNDETGNVRTNTHYQCPMRCEGDKVYDHPGTCPVCNMKLVPMNEKNSPDTLKK